MKVCEYGCGNEAKFQLKNGKWCCCEKFNTCPEVRRKNSETNKRKQSGENNGMYGRKQTIESRRKNSESNKRAWADPNSTFNNKKYRVKLKQSKILVGKKRRRTISMIKKKYKIFSAMEEMRYNPDKPKEDREIQVRCANHNCPNSKEKGGWFTPTGSQMHERLRALEKESLDNDRFYCCNECKNTCPIYGLHYYPNKNENKIYTTEEYQTFREHALERDNYKCQYCSEPADHVHHERPQKLEPFFALDPDYAWSVCTKCHYKYGHTDNCSTGKLATKIC